MSVAGPGTLFERILAATGNLDGPDPAVWAAMRLASRWSAAVRVLHVLEPASSEPDPAAPDALIRARTRLEALYPAIGDSMPDLETEASAGCPWEEILAVETAMRADLVVLGPHRPPTAGARGVRPLGRLGSTAAGVLTMVGCPVLIVGQQTRTVEAFGCILVGIDFSGASESALRFAARLAEREGAGLHPLHMVPVPPYPKYTPDDFKADRRAAAERLSRFCQASIGSVPRGCHVAGGADPAAVLLEAADRIQADLIVLGSHGREAEGKWYPGSVVDAVGTRAVCPVAILNGPKALRSFGGEGPVDGSRMDRGVRVFTRRSKDGV